MENKILELPIAQLVKGKMKPQLSDRETEVLQLSADGKSNKEIAELLYITEDAVDARCRSIISKLGANNMKHAVAIGIRKKKIK